MQSVVHTLSLLVTIFYSSIIIPAAPANPPINEVLAKIQALAAKKVSPQNSSPLQPRQSAPLRQSVHVRAPSLEDRMKMIIEKQRAASTAATSQPIPPFLMREDGRPLGSERFTHKQTTSNNPQFKEIKGCIKIDQQCDSVPQFKVYFEGMETTTNDEGFFSFPIEKQAIEKYGVIICNKIKYSFGRHNTVDSFDLIPDMNYKYYKFTQNADGGGTWTQQEPDLHRNNLHIPRNTIVIALNPAYFERLETTWPGSFNADTLKLPRIILKAGHEKKIARKAIKSLLYGLDMSPFHTTVKHSCKEIGDGKAELMVDWAQ